MSKTISPELASIFNAFMVESLTPEFTMGFPVIKKGGRPSIYPKAMTMKERNARRAHKNRLERDAWLNANVEMRHTKHYQKLYKNSMK
jgi:hypothetical protein